MKIHTMLNTNQKVVIAILMSGKVDIRVRSIMRNNEDYFIIVKRSICQEDVTILNVCVTNNRVSKYM